ncbi:type IV secretion system DNA-binding domain-containing protein, partial [Acinetobacter sp. ULE_I064]|uniref:type IV secretion system DNA-binding domain-containing protein n=1 Tax=Acinetobacter sp. ULE_I064 TaxID=3373071 RepID=UPI003AF9A51B
CKSIVPVGKDANSEQWNSYARVLLKATMQYEQGLGNTPLMRNVQDTIALKETKELKKMLAGTDAMTLFVEGADRALGSAKFTLGDRLPPYKLMPQGDFSIVDFLQDDKKGNLYITWKEEQAESLKPLITAWADVIMGTILSLPPSSKRAIWVFLDELASLDALSSLTDAVEKGRKHGLRIVAGLQTISQIRDIYGKDLAQTIMANMRNLVVLGGSKSDAETAETMSKSLGEHEVIRENKQKNTKSGTGTTITESTHKEAVIMPAEIASLPILNAFISFAGDLPITRVKLKYNNFKINNEPFVES